MRGVPVCAGQLWGWVHPRGDDDKLWVPWDLGRPVIQLLVVLEVLSPTHMRTLALWKLSSGGLRRQVSIEAISKLTAERGWMLLA